MGNGRNIAFWFILFLVIVVLFNVFSSGSGSLQSREVNYSDFVVAIEGGEVKAATLDGEKVMFKGADRKEYVTIVPSDANVTDLLISNGVVIRAEQQEQSGLQSFLMLSLIHI